MKYYQYPPIGINARELERLNEQIEGDLETTEEIFPADSQGNHLSMGNSIMHTMSQMKDGTRKATGGGTKNDDLLPNKGETT
jgi:hypothetical protein